MRPLAGSTVPFLFQLFKSGFGGGMKRADRKQLDAKVSGKAEAKEDNTLIGVAAKVMSAPPL